MTFLRKTNRRDKTLPQWETASLSDLEVQGKSNTVCLLFLDSCCIIVFIVSIIAVAAATAITTAAAAAASSLQQLQKPTFSGSSELNIRGYL